MESSTGRDEPANHDADAFPPPARGPWHVLHVKSRQEKALAESLSAIDVAFFLPLVRQTRYYGKRKANTELPLFPGYLFLRGEIDDAYRADRTGRVAGVIKVNDQAGLDWELRNLHLALSRNAALEPYTLNPFKKGIRAEVRGGPFRGLQGIVEDEGANGRLILQVQMLGRAVSLEIERALLDVI